MAFLPFGGLGIGIGPDGVGPQVSIGAAWVPDRVLNMLGGSSQPPVKSSIRDQPNHHQQQGLSRKGRPLYGPTQPAKSVNFDNLFG